MKSSGMEWAGLGWNIATTLGLMTWLGIWLDEKWQSSPWALLGCLGIAFISFFSMILKISQKMQKDNLESEKEK